MNGFRSSTAPTTARVFHSSEASPQPKAGQVGLHFHEHPVAHLGVDDEGPDIGDLQTTILAHPEDFISPRRRGDAEKIFAEDAFK